MLNIHLKNLEFFAYHGLYEGENLIGSNYEVDCKIYFDEPNIPITAISQTYNYVDAFQSIQQHMNTPTPLLETILQKIEVDLQKKFPQMKALELSIYKLSPPIPQFKGKLGVCLSKKY